MSRRTNYHAVEAAKLSRRLEAACRRLERIEVEIEELITDMDHGLDDGAMTLGAVRHRLSEIAQAAFEGLRT